eukprot:15300466-Ditylum_brightwellii.AAC.1
MVVETQQPRMGHKEQALRVNMEQHSARQTRNAKFDCYPTISSSSTGPTRPMTQQSIKWEMVVETQQSAGREQTTTGSAC